MAKDFLNPFHCEVRRTGGYPYYDSDGLTKNSHNSHTGEDFVPKWDEYEENWNLYSVAPTTGLNARVVEVNDYGKASYGLTCVYEFTYNMKVYRVRYAHLQKLNVGLGDFIYPTTIVGIAGKSGNVIGRHLHIELLIKNGNSWTRLKPSNYINFDMTNISASQIVKPSGAVVTLPDYFAYDECNKQNALFITERGSYVHLVKKQNTNTDNLTDYYLVVSSFDPYYFTQRITEIIKNAITVPRDWTYDWVTGEGQ